FAGEKWRDSSACCVDGAPIGVRAQLSTHAGPAGTPAAHPNAARYDSFGAGSAPSRHFPGNAKKRRDRYVLRDRAVVEGPRHWGPGCGEPGAAGLLARGHEPA